MRNFPALAIFFKAILSFGMDLPTAGTIKDPKLLKIYNEIDEIYVARDRFIKSVYLQGLTITEKEAFISFSTDILQFNHEADVFEWERKIKLASDEEFKIIKMDLNRQFKPLLTELQELRKAVLQEFQHHDRTLSKISNLISSKFQGASVSSQQIETELVEIYLFLLDGLVKTVNATQESKSAVLKSAARERQKSKQTKSIIKALSASFEPNFSYEEALRIIIENLSPSLGKILIQYRGDIKNKKIENDRDHFILRKKSELKNGIEADLIKLTKAINQQDMVLFNHFFTKGFLLSLKAQDLIIALDDDAFKNPQREHRHIHTMIALSDALAHQEEIRAKIAAIEAEHAAQQAMKQAALESALIRAEEESSKEDLIQAINLSLQIEEHAPTPLHEKDGKVEEKPISDEVLVNDQHAALPSVTPQPKPKKSMAKPHNPQKEAERKARILARLDIPEKKDVVETLSTIPNERAQQLLKFLSSTARKVFEELSEGTNLHKQYTFSQLVNIVEGLGGVKVGGKTNGSHFTYAIAQIGSIHLVYSHGNNDARKLSGGYVMAFISQLKDLGFMKK